ncbi:STAS domain-containing protein [Niallia endozanthoxylica]|uniref:STAS domain-containing protein n=1 Tax=Niallia endozanthoxylica TaxID=2036016 RepID=A0A5J5HVU6_9BACI|nr:STAS domain-containing protein [Niallia endozanthoxylica]KAA9025793.1 STAS domain-containing protein [Niallia endozanthoxylica]
MEHAVNLKIDLGKFINSNLSFYTNEWLNYIENTKGYLTSLLKETGKWTTIVKEGNPLLKCVANYILDSNSDIVMTAAKISEEHAKIDFPIHLAWELFQSTRGIIWNAVKSFYIETEIDLDMKDCFDMERYINDIIDQFVEAYTSSYVSYKDNLLRSQRETVDELSVPIIPLSAKVCILPIVGNVDTYRAKKIRERTLLRISELKSQKLIIDISGVPYVDTAVVNHLFKIVKGIKFLGCSTIIVGIGPEIADTMIELGIEIDKEIKTKATLQQALQDMLFFHRN